MEVDDNIGLLHTKELSYLPPSTSCGVSYHDQEAQLLLRQWRRQRHEGLVIFFASTELEDTRDFQERSRRVVHRFDSEG